MRDYPGLGLPLRYNEQENYGFYPIGAHGSCSGSGSDVIFVRELAMMNIMEQLTDKEDWHKKVFDEEIVTKWRKEVLATPDEEFWKLAKSGKSQYWSREDGGEVRLYDDDHDWVQIPEGIMSETSFCCVCHSL